MDSQFENRVSVILVTQLKCTYSKRANESLAESGPLQKSQKHCFNCETELSAEAEYCHCCGQKWGPLKITLRSLLGDFIVQQFSIESRLFRTLRTLLFRPGQLTLEYSEGKRARYLSPIQLYLLTSVLFFLLLDTLAGIAPNSPIKISTGDVRQAVEDSDQQELSISFGFRRVQFTKEQFLEYLDSKPEHLESFFERHEMDIDPLSLFFAKASHAIMQPGGAKIFIAKYFKLFSQTVLVLMPIFGLILYLLYRRQSEGAVQCILFSAHVHSFAYVAMVLVSLFTALLWESEILLRATGIGIVGYFVWAQRIVFGGSWLGTIVKSLLASIIYLVCVLLFVVLLLPLVFFMM